MGDDGGNLGPQLAAMLKTMTTGLRRRRIWTFALAAGLVLRLLFVWKHPRFEGDTLIYGDLAHNLLAHHQYGLTEDGAVRSTLIRLPGYPLFLAACFAVFGTGRYLPVIGIQVAIDLLGCVLLANTAGRLWGRRARLTCLWLSCLCPFTANYAAAPLTETLSIFCVSLGFFALVRWRGHWDPERPRNGWAFLVGTACSGAVLLRPDGILLAGALVPAMAWDIWRRQRRNGWVGVGLCASCVAACLALWTLRNWHVYHVVEPLAPKYANDPGEPAPLGFARWYRTWATGLGDTTRVYWQYDGSILDPYDLPPWAYDSAAQKQQTVALLRRYNDESASTPAVEIAFGRLAAKRIQAHPVRFYVILPLARLGDMWLRPRTEIMQRLPLDWWRLRKRPRASAFSYLYGLLNLCLLAAAVRGLWRWWRYGGLGAVLVAMAGYVVLRSALLMTIDNSEPRYVLECFPVILLLASANATKRAPATKAEPLAAERDPY